MGRTADLWRAIEAGLENGSDTERKAVFPKNFLLALRAAVHSGLSSDEITSYILLAAALEGVRHNMPDTENLLQRTRALIRVMEGD